MVIDYHCPCCHSDTTVMRVKRTWSERHWQHKHHLKFKCQSCHEYFFVDPLEDEAQSDGTQVGD
jgi:transposase-like protein